MKNILTNILKEIETKLIKQFLEIVCQKSKPNSELFIYDDNYLSDFRGVRDVDGRLQAGAIISEQIGELYPYTEERKYLSIDPFTTPPWNCLELEGVEFPEKRKGAATWLMAEIIQETIDTEIEGVTKVLAIDRARKFYLDIGFEENVPVA